MSPYFIIQAIIEIKNCYFAGDANSMEPVCSTYFVLDGTVGHVFPPLLCNFDPVTNFF